jgi:sulfide:quinone oxidoreductase
MTISTYRRNLLKLIALSTVTSNLLASFNEVKQSKIKTDAKILIVGGGSGAITILSRLLKSLENPNITIIAPNEVHIYQPGQVYVASGLYKSNEILKSNKNYIPDNVRWIKDKVRAFDPESNFVITHKNKEVSYDYMIIATGLEYKYEAIKGLKKEDIGTNNISSVYLNDTDNGTAQGGDITWIWFNKLKSEAKVKKQKVLFTMPNTPIKCGAVSQNIMYLSANFLQKEKLSAEFIYTPNSGKLFGLKKVDNKLHKIQKRYPIVNKFNHNLIEIDIKNKIAIYEHKYEVKSDWDEDFEEWQSIEKKRDIVKLSYDFIHIVPPMFPTREIAESKLAKIHGHYRGWLDVERDTMQHKKYKNIFGIGDICGTPLGKTVPSASEQAKVVEKNIISLIVKESIKEKYNGYSVCPIKISFGEVIMAKFNYDGLIDKKMNSSKNEAKKWWNYDLYKAKDEYFNLLLKGRL